jgi:hypothetical protein
MARTQPVAHKKNMIDFFDETRLESLANVGMLQRYEKLLVFHRSLVAQIPDEGTPVNPYAYNTHAGAYVRALDEARYHFEEALVAFGKQPDNNNKK